MSKFDEITKMRIKELEEREKIGNSDYEYACVENIKEEKTREEKELEYALAYLNRPRKSLFEKLTSILDIFSYERPEDPRDYMTREQIEDYEKELEKREAYARSIILDDPLDFFS